MNVIIVIYRVHVWLISVKCMISMYEYFVFMFMFHHLCLIIYTYSFMFHHLCLIMISKNCEKLLGTYMKIKRNIARQLVGGECAVYIYY